MTTTRRQSTPLVFRHLPVGELLRVMLLIAVIALGSVIPAVAVSATAQSGGDSLPDSGVEDGDGPIGGDASVDDADGAPGKKGPDDGTDLLVRKWICPPGTVPGKPIEIYFELCTPSFKRFGFNLAGPGGMQARTTESGLATWTGLQSGHLTIWETVPSKYGEPFVYCTVVPEMSSAAPDSSPQLMPSGDATIEIDVGAPGFDVVCYWFNVESPPPRG